MKKNYSPELKAEIVLEILKEEKTLAQVASEKGIHPTVITRWKLTGLQNFHKLFNDEGQDQRALEKKYEEKMKELYVEIGRLTTQLGWLKKKSGIQHE